MGTEQKLGSMENLGIKVPLGPTVVIASFLLSHDDPRGERPNINLTAGNNAVWLTTPVTIRGELYDFIIGPDGITSSIAIRRSGGLPQIYSKEENMMIDIAGIERSELATFSNMPKDANAQVIYKRYLKEELRECYTVLTLSRNEIEKSIDTFSPFAKKRTLISGMKNRELSSLSTDFWATRITDRRNLPFGRELARKNNR